MMLPMMPWAGAEAAAVMLGADTARVTAATSGPTAGGAGRPMAPRGALAAAAEPADGAADVLGRLDQPLVPLLLLPLLLRACRGALAAAAAAATALAAAASALALAAASAFA